MNHRIIAWKSAAAAIAAAAALLAGPAQAQGFPSKPMKVFVPSAVGAASDLMIRVVADKLSERFKQPIVVENRAGAGGAIAAEAAAKAEPDGHTLFACTSSTQVTLPVVSSKLPYDPTRDFTYIALIGKADNLIVVPTSSPFKTIGDLVSFAREHPRKLSFGSAGMGSTPHLAAELLQSRMGFEATHAPYRGTPPAEADLVTGRLDFMFNNLAPALPNLQGGKTRALVVLGNKRSPALPATPTASEAGLNDFEVYSWVGLCGPAKMPREARERISTELQQVLAVPEVRARLTTFGLDYALMGTQEFEGFIRSELGRWGGVVKERNLKFE